MLTLAISDLYINIVCSCKLHVERFNHLSDGIYLFMAHTYWYVISIDVGALMAASLLAMLFSVDRCFALTYPLKHKGIWTAKKVGVLCGCVLSFALFYGFNYALRFVVRYPGRFAAYTVNGARRLPIGDIKWFKQACAFLEFILRFALPLTAMSVSNTWIIAVIRKSDLFRKEHVANGANTQTPKCLATTIGLVVVFFCTQMVHAGITFDGIIFGLEHRGTLFSETIYVAGNIFAKANSIVNVFVYLLLGREFRKVFLKMLRCWKVEKKTLPPVQLHVVDVTTPHAPPNEGVGPGNVL
jgi:hypothetical protein